MMKKRIHSGNVGMIVVGVDVGTGVPVGGRGVRVKVAVPVGRGVRDGPGVEVGLGVRLGVAVGGRTRVGVSSTSGGYSSSMAAYQSMPPGMANSVKRAPAK
jgi:hypothetical protein